MQQWSQAMSPDKIINISYQVPEKVRFRTKPVKKVKQVYSPPPGKLPHHCKLVEAYESVNEDILEALKIIRQSCDKKWSALKKSKPSENYNRFHLLLTSPQEKFKNMKTKYEKARRLSLSSTAEPEEFRMFRHNNFLQKRYSISNETSSLMLSPPANKMKSSFISSSIDSVVFDKSKSSEKSTGV